MSMPTRDQLADALANAVETLRDEPVTEAERQRYRNNDVQMADLAREMGVAWEVLLVAFTTALAEITGPMGMVAIPIGPARKLQ
jgi:hypothetical protein